MSDGEDLHTKWIRYRGKQRQRRRPYMEEEEWVEARAQREANPPPERPAGVDDHVWRCFLSYRSYCKNLGRSVPDFSEYMERHHGRRGCRSFGFRPKQKTPKAEKPAPKSTAKPSRNPQQDRGLRGSVQAIIYKINKKAMGLA